MKISLIVLVACATLASAIPVAEDPKTLNEQVRQKRGGWGYEPAVAFVPSPQIHTTVLGPTKTIVTAAHPPVTTTHYIVPQKTVVSYPVTASESYVWQSGPDHHYHVYQRHNPHYYYSYYPASTHILNHGPVMAW